MSHKKPNILIAGTPGTGKSSLSQQLMEHVQDYYVYLNVSDCVKANKLYEGLDEKRDSLILDEEALIDYLDEYLKRQSKGVIFEYHGCDLFQPEWLQAIFVLRTNNDLLYKRLSERNYSESKISENIQCEIFQVILDEAREAFDDEDVEIFELENNTEEDQATNLNRILDWIRSKV